MPARMIALITFIITVLVLLVMAGASTMESTATVSGSINVADSIVVSGTITGPSGPVTGARVIVNSFIEVLDDTTDSSGFYSLTIQADDLLNFHVRPQLADRLAQINYRLDGVTGNVSQDFTVGNLGGVLGLFNERFCIDPFFRKLH